MRRRGYTWKSKKKRDNKLSERNKNASSVRSNSNTNKKFRDSEKSKSRSSASKTGSEWKLRTEDYKSLREREWRLIDSPWRSGDRNSWRLKMNREDWLSWRKTDSVKSKRQRPRKRHSILPDFRNTNRIKKPKSFKSSLNRSAF